MKNRVTASLLGLLLMGCQSEDQLRSILFHEQVDDCYSQALNFDEPLYLMNEGDTVDITVLRSDNFGCVRDAEVLLQPFYGFPWNGAGNTLYYDLEFPAEETEVSMAITADQDDDPKGNQLYKLRVSFTNSEALVIVQDDDPSPTISFNTNRIDVPISQTNTTLQIPLDITGGDIFYGSAAFSQIEAEVDFHSTYSSVGSSAFSIQDHIRYFQRVFQIHTDDAGAYWIEVHVNYFAEVGDYATLSIEGPVTRLVDGYEIATSTGHFHVGNGTIEIHMVP